MQIETNDLDAGYNLSSSLSEKNTSDDLNINGNYVAAAFLAAGAVYLGYVAYNTYTFDQETLPEVKKLAGEYDMWSDAEKNSFFALEYSSRDNPTAVSIIDFNTKEIIDYETNGIATQSFASSASEAVEASTYNLKSDFLTALNTENYLDAHNIAKQAFETYKTSFLELNTEYMSSGPKFLMTALGSFTTGMAALVCIDHDFKQKKAEAAQKEVEPAE